MNIALLPLDERPANTRYPAQVAAIAGASIRLPPAETLPTLRQPANREALAAWAAEHVGQTAGTVASLDLLGHGGLIASRVHDEDAREVLARIQPLLDAPRNGPLYAFNVIQRTSNANDATEEADYWADYGVDLYRYSKALDQALSDPISAELQHSRAEYETRIPAAVRRTWLLRRLRNHTVNSAMLHAAARGAFELLVIPSDDTAPLGMGARERKHLQALRDALGLTNVLLYPGADDLCSALTARLINQLSEHTPRVFVHYTQPEMRGNIAPYEDRPIHMAVETQLQVVGASMVDSADAADVVLFVCPPFERVADRDPHWRMHASPARSAFLRAEVARIAVWQRAGKAVAVADVAFPNGAEPLLVEALFEGCDVAALAAFGGWNTAGNTLGSTLANACVPCRDVAARRRAVAHHLLEDWGYQSVVRTQLHVWLATTYRAENIPAEILAEATAFTAGQLAPIAARIAAAGLPCAPSTVRHPWQRTFEVDFDL